MGKFNLDDYIPVNERIIEFYHRYPDGSIQAEILEIDDSHVIMRASAYREPTDERPGVGHAHEINDGTNMMMKTSMLEICETSAWGRALAGLGLEVSKAIASREEMAAAEKREGKLVEKIATKAEPEKEEGYSKKMDLFKKIKGLHEVLGATGDEEKKTLLKESAVAASFTKMGIGQLEQYADFLQVKADSLQDKADAV
jgi:hypothetical protein